MLLLSFAFVVLGFQNCAPAAAPDEGGDVRSLADLNSDIAKYEAQLRNLALANRACVAASDCVVIAIGLKGCGGPRAHTFTSVKNDVSYLAALAAELMRLERQRTKLSPDLVDTCLLVEPPVLTCASNLCAIDPNVGVM